MAHNKGKPELAEIKITLAEKYERKAKLTKSTPARKRMHSKAARYRRQAEEIERADAS